MPTDIEIAQHARLKPIRDIAERLGIPDEALEPYGRTKAKVSLGWLAGLAGRPDGKLVLVSAISPTPAGEGKTTTTVGLGEALGRIGKKAAICLREPSLGPVFGMKGGAAGGGYAQVVPMEDINIERDWYELGEWRLDANGCCASGATRLPGVFDGVPGSWGARRLPVRLAAM